MYSLNPWTHKKDKDFFANYKMLHCLSADFLKTIPIMGLTAELSPDVLCMYDVILTNVCKLLVLRRY